MTTSDIVFTSWHPRTLLNESAGSQPAPEELREKARNEGYSDGYNEGLEAAKKESFERANAKVAQLQSLIDSLGEPFKNIEVEISEYLLSLVSVICKSVIRRELSTDTHHVRTTVERALELLSQENGNIKLMLHPDDAAVVSDNWSQELGELKIVSSPEIMQGGCQIQRNDSFVDATIETQLRKIIADLSIIPGPSDCSGEPAGVLDANRIDATTTRLEKGSNSDD